MQAEDVHAACHRFELECVVQLLIAEACGSKISCDFLSSDLSRLPLLQICGPVWLTRTGWTTSAATTPAA